MATPQADFGGDNVIPFGKYQGQPREALLSDTEYSDWLCAQQWFRENYAAVYQFVLNRGKTPQDTPEHNQMQSLFLDEAHRTSVALLCCGRPLQSYEFECGGWDVALGTRYIAQWSQTRVEIGVELKPDLGDDYPSVLRQVLKYSQGTRRVDYGRTVSVNLAEFRVVIARRAKFEHVTLQQVQQIYRQSGVRLYMEEDLIL